MQGEKMNSKRARMLRRVAKLQIDTETTYNEYMPPMYQLIDNMIMKTRAGQPREMQDCTRSTYKVIKKIDRGLNHKQKGELRGTY